MITLIHSFLSLFLPPPKDDRSPEEIARIERAWTEVFRRLDEQRAKRERRLPDYPS